MSTKKRIRAPFSQVPQEQKDRIKARRRSHQDDRRQDEMNLITVPIYDSQDQASTSSATPYCINSIAEASQNHTVINTTNRKTKNQPASSLAQAIDQPTEVLLTSLYDVSIGVVTGTLMQKKHRPQPLISTQADILDKVASCTICHAKRFPSEPPNFCCGNGEIDLYQTSMPSALQELYSGKSTESAHFLKYIRPYNSAFAFTSLRVHLDPKLNQRTKGVYTFRAQGQMYHSLYSLYNTTGVPKCMQIYFYDTQDEVENRRHERSNLQPVTIEKGIEILKQNPYSQFFRGLKALPNIETCEIYLKANPKSQGRNNSPPTVSQVAGIWNDNEDKKDVTEREIVVQKHDGHSVYIKYQYGLYDPLQYPLLFPCGEPGWHVGIEKRKKLRTQKAIAAESRILPTHSTTAEELLSNESSVFEQFVDSTNKVSVREFYAYRFQIRPSINITILESGRLLQQFAVDMYIKMETQRLDFFRWHQAEIRAELYQGIVDSITQGETQGSKVGKRIVLPGSFIGGPRDMRKRYMDAMRLVEKYGKPDLFLTMTCNPNWPEIKGELKRHEEVQNRPDLIARIFRSKFEELRKEVVKKKLFGDVAAYTFVIEFQKRGLPHVHMLIILKKASRILTPDQIDEFISAELPDKQQQPHLYAVVKKHMMHGPCGKLNEKSVCMYKGRCKDHYPRSHCTETTIGTNGYPTYKRRPNKTQSKDNSEDQNNTWVVPHNQYLVAKFDCHINVEVYSTIKAVKYLYKYIYKGHDKILYRVSTSQTNEDIDEIEQFQSARWVSAPEAMWRIFKFPLHQMTPAVISLQLHLNGAQLITFKKDTHLSTIIQSETLSRTMLTEFFWMNKNDPKTKSDKQLYKDFPQNNVWLTNTRHWKHRERKDVIGRVITANPNQGEVYYLRMLLSAIPGPESFEHLQTIEGTTYETNRQAAIAFGLIEDDSSNHQCMQEACAYSMPVSLRQLFCSILIYCAPANPRSLFLEFEENLAEDYIFNDKVSAAQARQPLLEALDNELQSMGKTLRHFQLDDLLQSAQQKTKIPKEVNDELGVYISEKDMISIKLLNEEQRYAFNAIIDAAIQKKQVAFFIDGPGGTGKTFLYKAILAQIRSQNQIAIATASSGVAASILPNGRTAHSRFKIPIDGEGKLSCNVGKQSGLAALLRQAALIIWDEASMAKRQTIEALDTLLRDLTDKDILFGGKVVVLGGDFRQILPVIPKGTREDCTNASLVQSYIWNSLIKLRLRENMRAKTDPSFCDYILRVGNGTEPMNEAGQIRLPDHLILHPNTATPTVDQLVSFVFPSLNTYALDPFAMTDCAILTPKNQAVDELNEAIMLKFPGKETTFFSFDNTNDADQQGLYLDFLHSICPTGMPPHRLVLKKNCPILLLRNINPAKGLCNGIRLICRDFKKHVILAEIAVGQQKYDQVFIPRILLQPNDPHLYPVEFTRKQFPVRVCFAMTINKAQGQTLDTVGIYLPQEVFSHGQLYVALSRATTAKKICVQLKHSETDASTSSHTANIVYTELLSQAQCI